MERFFAPMIGADRWSQSGRCTWGAAQRFAEQDRAKASTACPTFRSSARALPPAIARPRATMSQMSPARRPASIHDLLAGLLVAVFLLQSFFASLQKSPVYDEPPHIASGLSYLATGVFRANLQHPPLLKEMSALFLRAAGIEWPRTEEARALIRGAPEAENYEWPLGNEIIASNGPDRVMFWARLPFTLLAGLLAVLIYVWGRELAGPAAAQGALFLYALDPTILAHSFLVTTDVGLAAFSMLFLWTVWRYVERAGGAWRFAGWRWGPCWERNSRRFSWPPPRRS